MHIAKIFHVIPIFSILFKQSNILDPTLNLLSNDGDKLCNSYGLQHDSSNEGKDYTADTFYSPNSTNISNSSQNGMGYFFMPTSRILKNH